MNEIRDINTKIDIKPYSPNLGGVVKGIDLSKKISDGATIHYHA